MAAPERPRYELLDHTADVAIRVRGSDLSEIVANLAWAVVDLMASASRVEPRASVPIALVGERIEELLVAWANEILFHRETAGLLLPHADVAVATATEIRAVARGEPLDPERHEWKGELKSATYHDLALRREGGDHGDWVVDMVVDI